MADKASDPPDWTSGLAQFPCFLLYVGWRKAQALYRPVLQQGNPQRLYVMHLLSTRGPMTISRIASALELELPGTSGIVSRMVKDGLVERSRNKANHLEKICSMTKLGQKTFRQQSERIEAIDRHLMARLDDADVAALNRIVMTMGDMISESA
ncbi:MAG: MarR family transcriptional regulator [Parvularcula sp.]|jgi:DNA-binding MarR family transcriptional regulator|nr:MarR family transcriptional regulator [Parvularcula sp.]